MFSMSLSHIYLSYHVWLSWLPKYTQKLILWYAEARGAWHFTYKSMFVLSMSCTWQFTSIRNEFSRWTWIRYIFLLLNVIEVQAWRKYKDLCMWIRMKSGRDKSTQKARRLFAWCFFLGMLPPAPAPYPHIGTQIRKFHFLWG